MYNIYICIYILYTIYLTPGTAGPDTKLCAGGGGGYDPGGNSRSS